MHHQSSGPHNNSKTLSDDTQKRYFTSSQRLTKQLSRVQLFVNLWTIQSMKFSRPEYWNGQPFSSPGDLPNPGIKPWSPTLQVVSLPAGPQGKPKNTGVGSLSLLHWIFPTQESIWGLLHCRRILHQLSYQGSPLTKTPHSRWKNCFIGWANEIMLIFKSCPLKSSEIQL